MIKWIFRFVALILILLGTNWVYQVINKPLEIVNLVSGHFYKSPQSTWEAYEDLFQSHATEVMTPEFLAGMAQVESSGNAFAVSGWRWRWTTNITRIYSPASSATGMLQYTDATFEDAKRFCVHQGKVVLNDNFLNLESCWFNQFYSRISPSNAIEMTSARLQYYVDQIVVRYKVHPTKSQKQQLAAVIHLCGRRKGKLFAKKGFKFSAIPRCGSHNPKYYYKKIRKFEKKFKKFG
ncbi:MAG: transglycosylase [SAR324 cluster bacterium]|uniref:Transglycosylase n=1 Tax=SAR324 cluster bacterium TaxID=2024889 RepID=A0A2A4T743_9DELT|nr:MAG: transglycosylase [SAR324 cluster bacterium]